MECGDISWATTTMIKMSNIKSFLVDALSTKWSKDIKNVQVFFVTLLLLVGNLKVRWKSTKNKEKYTSVD